MSALKDVSDEHFCDVLMGIHHMHERVWGEPFVDFNMLDMKGADIYGRPENALEALDAVIFADNFEDPHIYQRAVAAWYYLYDRLSHQTVPYQELLYHTGGYEFKQADPLVLQAYEARIDELTASIFGQTGLTSPHIDALTVQHFRVFEQSEVKGFFRSQFARYQSEIADICGADNPLKLNYSEIDDPNAQFLFWINGNGVSVDLLYNMGLYKEDAIIRAQSVMEYFFSHEILTHGVQANLWRQHIQSNELPKHVGLMFVQGPESFGMEGLAQVRPLMQARAEGNEMMELSMLVSHLSKMSLMDAFYAYVHCDGNQADKDAAANEIMGQRRIQTLEKASDRIKGDAGSSTGRTYTVSVYGNSFEFFARAQMRLSEQGFAAFLDESLRSWDTPDTLKVRLDGYIAQEAKPGVLLQPDGQSL